METRRTVSLAAIYAIPIGLGIAIFCHEFYVRNYLATKKGITVNTEVVRLPAEGQATGMRNSRHAFIEVAYEQNRYMIPVSHKSLRDGQYKQGGQAKALFIPGSDRMLSLDADVKWSWMFSPFLWGFFLPLLTLIDDGVGPRKRQIRKAKTGQTQRFLL